MNTPQIDWNDPSHFTQPKRTFHIVYEGFGAGDVFDFDFTVELTLSDAMLHEVNNFWSNNEYRLRCAKGDITIAVLGLLRGQVVRLCMEGETSKYFINREMEKMEGWPGKGITITNVNWDWLVEPDEYTITEVTS